jgi:hypothetical protein
MHAKQWCLDHRLLRDGSANWSHSGEVTQDNQIHVTSDPRQIAAFEKTFEVMWSRPSNLVIQQVILSFNRRLAVLRSVFIFSCVCGCEFQKEGKEAFHCPDCGRLLVLDWRAEDGAAGSSEMTVSGEASRFRTRCAPLSVYTNLGIMDYGE